MKHSAPVSDVIIAQYEIAAPISQGSMFDVFLAYHTQFGWPAAIKVLQKEYLLDDDLVQQVYDQLKSVAQQVHPNVVLTYDVGFTESGRPYSAMALVEGVTLSKKLTRMKQEESRFPKREVILLGLGLAEGLATLSRAGIIHSDINPEHIIVQRDNLPVIIGLGDSARFIAELGIEEESSGSNRYQARETIDGIALDPRSNIYSLGILLYELFTLNLHPGADYLNSTEPLVPLSELRPDLAEETCSIVEKCLASEISDRFQSWSELITALNLALNAEAEHKQDGGLPAGWMLPLRQIFQDRSSRNFAIILILLVVGFGLILVLLLSSGGQGDGVVNLDSMLIDGNGQIGGNRSGDSVIQIQLIDPANNAAVRLDDQLTISWCWSGELEPNEQFAVYFDLGRVQRRFDVVPEQTEESCYEFIVHVVDVSNVPGEYEWHMAILDSETRIITAESESRNLAIFVRQTLNTQTPTPTNTATASLTFTPSPTRTPTSTSTPTSTPTNTATSTPIPLPTATIETPSPTPVTPSPTSTPVPPPPPTSTQRPPSTSTPPPPPTSTPPMAATEPPPPEPTATAVSAISSIYDVLEQR